MSPKESTVRSYSTEAFIDALRKANHLEVVHTSSDEWPEGSNWPMSVAMRVHMAVGSGKAVLIVKDGAYRYYLPGESLTAANRRS